MAVRYDTGNSDTRFSNVGLDSGFKLGHYQTDIVRAFGYILLIIGFLWLAIWCAASVGPLTRSIGMENYHKYPDTGKYSARDVRGAIHDVLIEYQENAHGVTIPAALMLIGGILLDMASRRHKTK